MKELDSTKLEFLMTVNQNIIVQRFFNVRDYNPNAKYSEDLYLFLKEFKDLVSAEFKLKSVIYLLENKEEIKDNPELLNTSYTDGPENFNIYIKINDMTICHRMFDAKVFPPKIRYTVDIRPHIKRLLTSLTEIFSSNELSYEYAEVKLDV
tara:strand:- start:267 stop:719 length:453 start_codon:yes stop_codon:yes gene_type:complete